MRIKAVLGLNGYKSKDGRFPLQIRVHSGNKRTIINTGIRLKKEEWDARASRAKNHISASEINLKLIEMTGQIEKNFINDGAITDGNRKDFYWWFEERLKYSRKKHGTYNYEKLVTVMNKLKKFAPQLPLSKLNYKFLIDYEKYLLGMGNHPNTIADNFNRIKIIVNMILRSGALEYSKNPFHGFEISTQRTHKKRIPVSDIEKLRAARFDNKATQMAVDMYLTSFYCAGIRFGDICRLRWEWVKAGRLKYPMHKSMKIRNADRDIKLFPQVLEILDRYKENRIYVFNTGVDWKDEDKSINRRNSYFNKLLKRACVQIGIQPITYHTSRNSFADYAKSKNTDIHTLKDLFGHSKTSITEIYMRDFYKEETDEAMGKLFAAVESGPHKPVDDPDPVEPGDQE